MVFECTDKQLILGAKKYFESRASLKEIFVSEDAQYFYSVGHSNYHCRNKQCKVFRVSREQALKSETKKAEQAKPAASADTKKDIKKTSKK